MPSEHQGPEPLEHRINRSWRFKPKQVSIYIVAAGAIAYSEVFVYLTMRKAGLRETRSYTASVNRPERYQQKVDDFFQRYDRDGNGSIDPQEYRLKLSSGDRCNEDFMNAFAPNPLPCP